MSYTVLALKWRPRKFGDLVGQQHVVQALVNSLGAGRLHHAYLFAGTRGVGKTTIARILAKALNCDQGVATEPCGSCDACVAIDEGRFVDLLEVDAASRTRVDDTRDLLDNVQYAPTRGRYKVYLIDEVHMLSTHSFNALLKTLEEPPPHVKFLLATTDPQKLPVTVLSRCLQFNLKKLSVTQIREQLEKVCTSENVPFDSDALAVIAESAAGSMRDAQSLLDQAIAFGGGEVRHEPVRAMLGTIDRTQVLRLLEALAAGDGNALIRESETLDGQAADFGAVLDELMRALQRIALIQLVRERDDGVDPPEFDSLAQAITPEDVQLYYQIALNGRRDLAYCRDDRTGFEMTLLRMLAFRPGEPGTAAVSRPASASTPMPASSSSSTSAASKRTASVTDQGPSAVTREDARSMPSGNEADDWIDLLTAADVRGMARQLADNCQIAGRSGDRIELALKPEKAHLHTEQLRGRLEAALGEHLGRTVRVTITIGNPAGPTPADVRQARESHRMRVAREAIEQDQNVQALRSAFDAVLEADSIHPLEPGNER